jgi:hypothetical protein
VNPVPYSQHASCTTLGNRPTVWIFSYKEDGVLDIDELFGISIIYAVV